MNIKQNVSLAQYTTLEIGGPARYFVEVKSEDELKEALRWAKEKGVETIVIAGGSNLLIHDDGYDGLVIKLSFGGITSDGKVVRIGAGESLQNLVDFANENGLSGAEQLAGIPGTVGGAIYGNAGAYGQTISDKINRVRIFKNGENKWIEKDECGFNYRESGFKTDKNLVILEVEFVFEEGNSSELTKISDDTILKRTEKYKPGIKCPGSFFKNILISKLPKMTQKSMPKDYYGKAPAWWFLEQVGAKGARRGAIEIADFHANLFVNTGGGSAQDFYDLAKEYQNKVYEKFGIKLETEVQLVGFRETL
ncbi:MAG: UDP-N-acetylmuramate dehydrogenase [Patescibacteria group bacterium]